MRQVQFSLIVLLIFSCFKTESSKNGIKSKAIKSDQVEVEYVIVQEDYYYNFGKCSMVVLLKNKTTEDQIRKIAYEIRTSGDRKKYDPFFISYYLPGMEIDAGAYATSHFDPDLSVEIYESTLEINPPETDSTEIEELFEKAEQEGTTFRRHPGL